MNEAEAIGHGFHTGLGGLAQAFGQAVVVHRANAAHARADQAEWNATYSATRARVARGVSADLRTQLAEAQSENLDLLEEISKLKADLKRVADAYVNLRAKHAA